MKVNLNKTWDLKKRLVTWNNNNFGNKNNNNQPRIKKDFETEKGDPNAEL